MKIIKRRKFSFPVVVISIGSTEVSVLLLGGISSYFYALIVVEYVRRRSPWERSGGSERLATGLFCMFNQGYVGILAVLNGVSVF